MTHYAHYSSTAHYAHYSMRYFIEVHEYCDVIIKYVALNISI
jgi:hypothetical protein